MKIDVGNRVWLPVTVAVCLGGAAFVAPEAAAQTKPMLSDQVFKNVQVLKGIPLDDFMGAMGVMTASLSYDCSECHIGRRHRYSKLGSRYARKSGRAQNGHHGGGH